MEFKQPQQPKRNKKLGLGHKPERPDQDYSEDQIAVDWFKNDTDWIELYKDTQKERVKKEKTKQALKRVRQQKEKTNSTPLSSDINKNVEVNIKLTVPRFSKASIFIWFKNLSLKVKEKSILNRRKIVIFGTLVCIFIIIFVSFKMFINRKVPDPGTGQSKPKVSHEPKFDIVTPAGRDIKKESIQYDAEKNFAKYDDQIDGVQISVSQQPVPNNFKGNEAAELKLVAEGFAAKDQLQTDNDVAAYIGRSAKGPQTVILIKKDKLMFIKTASQIDVKSIEVYVNNLD